MFKKQWKIYKFENFKGNFAIFWKVLKVYRKFRENLGRNFENFGKMDLRGFGDPAKASKNIKRLVKK